jgi:hypothetical protein
VAVHQKEKTLDSSVQQHDGKLESGGMVMAMLKLWGLGEGG